MEFYEIQGKELKFFQSFLSERTCFVEIETKRSNVRVQKDCSVIQGSKMSSVLYSLFTNEAPEIKKLMEDEVSLKKILKKDDIEIIEAEHETYAYVDDTYNCVAVNNPEELEVYVNNFFKVLIEFHNANKLKLNEEKTTFLVTAMPRHQDKAKSIEIEVENDENVKPSTQIKILGFLTNVRGKNDSQANKVIREMSHEINKAEKVKKFLNVKTRKCLMNSNIISRLKYNAPLIAGATEDIKKRIYKVIHRAGRFVRNDYCFMQSIRQIMKSINWKMPEEMVNESSARFIHRVVYSGKPKSINKKIKVPRSRSSAEYAPATRANSNRLERTPIHAGLINFNRIPPEMRGLSPKKLAKRMKKMSLKPQKVS